MSFHIGRTDKLIGGAVAPRTSAVMISDSFVCIELKNKIEAAYAGTRIRIGHFCPQRSITDPRIPAVNDPAIPEHPIAKPARATESVVC